MDFAETAIPTLIEENLRKSDSVSLDFLKIMTKFYYHNEKEFPILMTRDIRFLNKVKEIAKQGILQGEKQISAENYTEIEYILEYQISAIIGVLNLWIAKEQDISFEALSSLIFRISTTGVLTTMSKQLKAQEPSKG